MNKGKICLLVLFLAIALSFVVVRSVSTQKILSNGDTTATSVIDQLVSETVNHTEIRETEISVSEDPTQVQNEEQDHLRKEEQQDKKDPYLETNVQPEGNETLPSNVNVSMGVVEGSTNKNLDEDDSGNVTSDKLDKPTETKPTEPKPMEPTPTETTPTTRPSSGSTTDPLSDNYDLTTLTYEGYIAMTGEQQQAVIDWFSTPDEFIKWFNLVEARYKEAHPDIEIGSDGVIDLS